MERIPTIICSTSNCIYNKNSKCKRCEIEIDNGECCTYEWENEEDEERD